MPTRPPRTLSEAGRARGQTLPLGPNGLPLCRWCQLEVLARRRRTFCSAYCVHQWRLRSDPGYLRDLVFARDRGICQACNTDTVAAYAALKHARGRACVEALALWGMKSITARRSLWDADHILPSLRAVANAIWTTFARSASHVTGRPQPIYAVA